MGCYTNFRRFVLERIWVFYQKALPEKIDEITYQIEPYIEQAGTSHQKIRFYSGLNYAIVRKNRYQVSREVVDSERCSLAIAQESGDTALISECEFNAGILSLLHGDLESAIELLTKGLARAQKVGLHPIELQCIVYLIAAYRAQGNHQAVQELLPGCLEIADRIGQPNYQGAALTHQGWLYYHYGDYTQARQSVGKALEFWDATKTYPFQWMGLWLLFAMAFSQGEIDLALQYVARITDPIQQAPPPEIETLLQSALQASKEGQGEKVKSALESALELARVQGYL